MADRYDWTDERGYRGAEDGRRDREPAADARYQGRPERSWSGRGEQGAGWYGENAAREGARIPGPHGQGSEQDRYAQSRYQADYGSGGYRSDDPSNFDRYARDDSFAEQPSRYGRRPDDDAREYGRGPDVGDRVRQGWERMTHGVRDAFSQDRSGEYGADRSRGGGMFGGRDRDDTLFSHGDGYRGLGPHAGKGPKGYSRSDDRIRDDISDRLTDDHHLDASEVEVRVENGEATLSGYVHDRRDKRRAEDIVERVSGVGHVQNNLRVHARHDQDSEAGRKNATQGQSADQGRQGLAGQSSGSVVASLADGNSSPSKAN